MGSTTDNRKRRVDTAGSLAPSEVWDGKTWYDYDTNRLKIYSVVSGAWISEEDFTWSIYKAIDVVSTVSGGAYTP